MYKSVLVYAYIYKHAEVYHVAHCAFKQHTLFEVLHFEYVAAQYRHGHFVAGVAGGLFQLCNYVAQGQFAYTELLGKAVVVGDGFGQSRKVAYIIRVDMLRFHQLPCGFVAFGVDAGCVQRVVAVRDTQKSCALFVRLCAQLVYV